MRKYETKFYNYTEKNSGRQVVKATTLFAGKPINAFAKCDPADTFDKEFGEKVAEKRLDIKITKKNAASCRRRARVYAGLITELEAALVRARKAKANAETQAAKIDRATEGLEAELAAIIQGVQ